MTLVFPVRSRTPARFGRYPICCATSRTRSFVACPISGASLSARDTVVTPSPVM